MLLHQEVWISIPEEDGIMQIKERKRLTRDLQHGTRSIVKRGSHKVVQMMHSGVNPRMTKKIVGCKIVCTISHSCNSVIIQC